MVLFLGFWSWLLSGLLTGLSAQRMLPGVPPLKPLQAGLGGVTGALAGGLLATGLGFGGLAAFDVRSLATATLSAVLAVLVTRYVTLDV